MRLIPVTSNHTGYCKEIADAISNKPVRVDIDDRDESVGKKIRDAEMEWINYIVVVGDTEVEEARFQIRNRLNPSERKTMTMEGLVNEITNKTADKPYLPLNLPYVTIEETSIRQLAHRYIGSHSWQILVTMNKPFAN